MPDDILKTEEELCNDIMNKTCDIQFYLITKLSDDEYEKVKGLLDDIWCAAHAIKGN